MDENLELALELAIKDPNYFTNRKLQEMLKKLKDELDRLKLVDDIRFQLQLFVNLHCHDEYKKWMEEKGKGDML